MKYYAGGRVGQVAFPTEQFLHYLPLEFLTEGTLIPHGKVPSFL